MSLQFTRKETDRYKPISDIYSVSDIYKTGHNKVVDLIYLDFQKAFDKVPDEMILVKFIAHGIQGSAAQWIRYWLAGRHQRACASQTSSSWTPVTSELVRQPLPELLRLELPA